MSAISIGVQAAPRQKALNQEIGSTRELIDDATMQHGSGVPRIASLDHAVYAGLDQLYRSAFSVFRKAQVDQR